MQIHPHEIHIWSRELTISHEQATQMSSCLSSDEIKRANQFRFPHHRQRFIAARYTLRHLLSLYLRLTPQEIVFSYTATKKPYLASRSLSFNLSHTGDKALFAIAQGGDIGIDMEKQECFLNEDLAQRFFSKVEYQALMHLSPEQRTTGFYHLWTRKEALLKAIGVGPLSNFSVAANASFEKIFLANQAWLLTSLNTPADYPAALATNKKFHKITYWQFSDHGILFQEEVLF
jgi:4'-phosphopantetheinyl transferase